MILRMILLQVADMEKALDASAGATPARSIVEGLAEKFTSERNGREVQWKQVFFPFLALCCRNCFLSLCILFYANRPSQSLS